MEFITIFLSGLLASISPTGLIVDTVVENRISSRLAEVEELEVRIDNAPSYQIIQGKIEKVRLAGRGLYLTPDLRINALELETDPISINLKTIREGTFQIRKSLREPLQGGVRLELSEQDLNTAIQSPNFQARLQAAVARIAGGFTNTPGEEYELVDSRIDFLDENRLRLEMELRRNNPDEPSDGQLNLTVESQISVSQGHAIKLIEPTVIINDNPLPSFLLQGFITGLSDRLDLKELEQTGILARVLQLEIDEEAMNLFLIVRPLPKYQSRVLQLEIDEEAMNLAAFVRLEPLQADSLP